MPGANSMGGNGPMLISQFVEQAIDRVHRIGQTLRVQVVRLLVNDTIEQKVVALQQKKARIIHGALGDGAIQSTKLTTQEIRKLFDL
jgi:SNF2 family DNA or RNA helicase